MVWVAYSARSTYSVWSPVSLLRYVDRHVLVFSSYFRCGMWISMLWCLCRMSAAVLSGRTASTVWAAMLWMVCHAISKCARGIHIMPTLYGLQRTVFAVCDSVGQPPFLLRQLGACGIASQRPFLSRLTDSCAGCQSINQGRSISPHLSKAL